MANIRFKCFLIACASALTACKNNQHEGADRVTAIRVVTDNAINPKRVEPTPDELRKKAELKAWKEFEARYPLHGIALHYITQVYSEPTKRSRIIGYLRRGARFRAAYVAKSASTGQGCGGKGWYVLPGKGYVCPTLGVKVGNEPQFFELSPTAAAIDSGMPYVYVRNNVQDTPQYWRIPTPDEEQAAIEAIAALRESETKKMEAASAPTTSENEQSPEALTVADVVEAPPPPGQVEVEEGAAPLDVFAQLPAYLRMPMNRGFYVSVDRTELSDDARQFARTIRGAYIPMDALSEVTPPTMRGVVLGGAWNLPLGFVYKPGTRMLIQQSEKGAIRELGEVERFTPIVIKEYFDRGGKHFAMTKDGLAFRQSSLRVAELTKKPPLVPANAKWIHIRLSTQTLVAYEGTRPVFATLVSAGRDEHPTPTGIFQIQSKHVATTMDDMRTMENMYSIEDVPWTMYFQANYALHGAFWHDSFGRVRSHGCVNLSPVDARWLFFWSTPHLPNGWHGVFKLDQEAPTWVVVDA